MIRNVQVVAYRALIAVLLIAAVAGPIIARSIGKREGIALGRADLLAEQRQVVAKQIAAQQKATAKKVEVQKSTEKKAVAAGKVHTAARARVVIVNDSSVSIDNKPTMILPDSIRPVIAVIQTGDEKIRADSADRAALKDLNASLMVERDLWKQRALLAEAEVVELRRLKTPRFTFKRGVLAGAGIAIGVVHWLK